MPSGRWVNSYPKYLYKMKRIIYFLLCFTGILSGLSAQAIGEWRMHFAYYETTAVAEASQQVFAISNGSLFSYGKEDGKVSFYSRQTGLNDTEISHIRYNTTAKCLLIVYANQNIDIMGEEGIKNVPDLKNSTSIPDKEVNSIYFKDKLAYLSTQFGILVLDLSKGEVVETYRLNKPTRSVCMKDNFIYAATSSGIFRAAIGDNLIDPNNWKLYSLNSPEFSDSNIVQISLYKNVLCFCVAGNGIYYQNANGEIINILRTNNIQNMLLEGDRLLAYSSTNFYVLYDLTSFETVNAQIVKGVSSFGGGKYWIAGGSKGLSGYQYKSPYQYEVFLSDLQTNSPKRNLAAYMAFQDQKLYVTGGGRRGVPYYNPGTLMTYQNDTWYSFDENEINRQAGVVCYDFMYIAIDPKDTGHFFISSFGEGLLEFKENAFVKLYGSKDGLEYYEGGDPSSTVRVEGLAFDKEGNLWMTNSNSQLNGIKILKADGTLTGLPYLGNNDMTDKILITSAGHVWVNIFRTSKAPAGFFVLNPNGTADDPSDDQYKNINAFITVTNETISASEFYCMVEDKNGVIWIGSNKGPILCSNPKRVLTTDGSAFFSRIIRMGDDGLPYAFLDGESVTTIAVDGGNRKWLGTSSSGVFLLSADGTETIENFTTTNSPLPSNTIQSIAINDRTGEVFFGTDKGIASYMAEGTEASSNYSDVYAYPNPVRPDFDGPVTITGLMMDSNVKITDINGNLIYQTKSVGGQATWNCRNGKGERVSTGIYLVLAATPEGNEGVVSKILVVK